MLLLTDPPRRLIRPAFKTLILAGCGGTGSWLAAHLARLARLYQEKGHELAVHFVDPDRVEARNVYRQAFSLAEVGTYKAEALAFRLNAAWGLDIRAFCGPLQSFSTGWRDDAILYIGCVDNAAARREITNRASKATNAWWLDCGNARACGQVLLGRGAALRPGENPFALQGLCTWLPSPALQHPELLEDEPGDNPAHPAGDELSCADLALQDAQSMSINARIAAEAADILFRLLFGGLTRYAAYMALEAGSTNSRYIIDEEIGVYSIK